MGFKDPQGIAVAGVETGAKKALLPPDKALVAGFLAGAYIAFAGLLAISALGAFTMGIVNAPDHSGRLPGERAAGRPSRPARRHRAPSA